VSLVDDVRRLPREQKLAGGAAIALFISMLLPWYTKSLATPRGGLIHDNLNAFQVFSWVEAAVLLVSASVLALLYARSQKRGFHLPGGDGTAIMLAGGWTALLIVWRMFDKPNLQGDEGIQWGIFVAFLAAGALAWAGARIRAAHRPEPPLPVATVEEPTPPASPPDRPRRDRPRSDRPRTERAPDRRPHTAPTEPLGEDPKELAVDDPPAYQPPPRRR
jgi:hypothetical protein